MRWFIVTSDGTVRETMADHGNIGLALWFEMDWHVRMFPNVDYAVMTAESVKVLWNGEVKSRRQEEKI